MKTNQPIPQPISELRRRVDAWRATRASKGPMPEPLWSEAGRLAQQYGIFAVSRGARLAYDGVKKRAKGGAENRFSQTQELAGPFIELPVAPLGARQGVEVAVVELRDARGRSLAVRMMPQALSQLPELATKLWGLS